MCNLIASIEMKNCKYILAYFFIDKNECLMGHSCQQICSNLAPGYTCLCKTGFKLNSDGKTCAGMS